MARVKQTTRRRQDPKPLTTWTRFYLPEDQEWPVWTVDHDDIHVGPLADLEGCQKVSLGRMVEHPEQAAYIIEWATMDAFRDFQSSAACAEFLRNLPQDDNDRPTAQLNLALEDKSLDDAPPPTTTSLQSRFLTLQHVVEYRPTQKAEGRVTFTTFLVPRAVDDVVRMWENDFRKPFGRFEPHGFEPRGMYIGFEVSRPAVWLSVREEDGWVEETFGNVGQTAHGAGEPPGRTLLCYFYTWAPKYRTSPEQEEASVADPLARESWTEAIAQVMPPATAWHQERWDIQEVPRFFPPELFDEEELAWEIEMKQSVEEWARALGLDRGEGSQ